MSKYTTEVRYICENYANLKASVDYSKVDEIIKLALPKIFDFSFPIFDENYRNILETKIIKHFYTREIGLETVALWKLKLQTKLQEIMPLYNQLYKSELLEFNPFYDVDLTRKHNGSTNNENNSTVNINNENTNIINSSQNNNSKSLYSDTPQGGVDGLESQKFLTNATIDTDNIINNSNQNNKTTGTTTGIEKTTNIDSYTEVVLGKQGSENFSDLLVKFRQTFLNIDMLIIDELNSLFLNLW